MFKKIIIIISCFLLVIGGIFLYLLNKTNNNSLVVFRLILPEKQENIHEYLFFYDFYEYYLDGYHLDECYIVISEDGTTINDSLLNLAKKCILDNQFYFKDENNHMYRILYLKEALYNFDISITWLEDLLPIYKEKESDVFENINIIFQNDEKEYKLLVNNENIKAKIFSKGYDFQFQYNKNVYNSLSDIEFFSVDMFIEKIFSICEIENTISNIDKSVTKVLNCQEEKIAVKRVINRNVIEYYFFKYL